MYNYITDKEFLKDIRSLSGKMIQELCHELKETYEIGASFFLVGSGARNLILQNANQPIDLDYNLNILKINNINDCKIIKENVKKAFNKILTKHGFKDCDDSTSSLTTKIIHLPQGNNIGFSIDLCIVHKGQDGNYHRLIHEKNAYPNNDRYYWNPSPNSNNIKMKVDYIKTNGKWDLVKEQYKNIKNMYLTKNVHNHPSFVCYAEAVNNVYNLMK